MSVTSPFFGLELDGDDDSLEFDQQNRAWQARLRRVNIAIYERDLDALRPKRKREFLKLVEHRSSTGGYSYRLALVHPIDPDYHIDFIVLLSEEPRQLSPHAALDTVETELFGQPERTAEGYEGRWPSE